MRVMNTDISISDKTPAGSASTASDRILWLSILQGWAIFLVVLGHVNGFTHSGAPGEVYPVAGWIQRFCYSFHMPLFMFVSGGLLYYSRLRKGWSTGRLYRDKLERLLIPYIAFTVIGFLVKMPFSGLSKRGMDTSLGGFLDALIDPGNGPLGELWFLGALMWLMLMYPLYRSALRSAWGELTLLAMTLVPFVFNLWPEFSGWLALANVPVYAFFFVGGILFFKYDGMRLFAGRGWLTVLLTAAQLATVALGMPLPVTAVLGILMSMGWASMLTRFPGLFASFRDHSFQIFLVGIFPQMAIELLVWRSFHEEWMLFPYYVVSCGLALACGVLVSKSASRLPYRWLRLCFGAK